MCRDDACALLGAERIVRVHAVLVLGEEGGIAQLADVVVHRAGAHEHGVGADDAGGVGSEIRHGHGVLERAGALVAEAAQQRVVAVGQFHERNLAHKAEGALGGEHQHVGQLHEGGAAAEEDDHAPRPSVERAVEHQLDGGIGQQIDHADEGRRAKHLRAARHVAQRIDRRRGAGGLEEDVLQREGGDGGAQQRDDQGCEDGRAAVEEHLHKGCHHGHGHEIYAEHDVALEHGREQEEQHREAHHKQEGAGIVGDFGAEEVEIGHEHAEAQQHVERAAEQHERVRRAGAAQLVVNHALVGAQVGEVLGRDERAFVHDGLSLLDDAAVGRQRQIVIVVVAAALHGVVHDVGPQQRGQRRGHVAAQGRVGGRGVHAAVYLGGRREGRGAYLAEYVLVEDAHAAELAAGHALPRVGVDHAGGVEAPQARGCLRPVRTGRQSGGYGVGQQLVDAEHGHEMCVERVAHAVERGRVGMHGDVEGRDELGVVPRTPLFVLVVRGVGLREAQQHQHGRGQDQDALPDDAFARENACHVI